MKVLSPLEGYNLWSRSYHEENNPIKRMSDDFILNELPDLEGKRMLDAGCGTGKICVEAVKRNAALVKGIDLSPKMIEKAKKNCPQAQFECADLSTVTLEKFDAVVCGLVLGHIEMVEPVLSKLVNSLNPGGHLIITDFHPYQTMMNARRTFRYRWRTYEVKHSLHTLEEYSTLLKSLSIKTFKEPQYNDQRVIFGIHGVAA